MRSRPWIVLLAAAAATAGCESRSAPPDASVAGGCTTAGQSWCDGDTLVSCGSDLVGVRDACGARGLACTPDGCRTCRPSELGCFEGDAARCDEDGSGWTVVEECGLASGQACVAGSCISMCDAAESARSYVGCEFYPVDLPTSGGYESSFGIIVSNPNAFPTAVQIEINTAAVSEPAQVEVLDRATIPPMDLEVFVVPRRRLDGLDELASGTVSALSSRAYRVRSVHPVIAYQFSPLQEADVFSNDASLLLPTSAQGERYTVVGWPQTLTTQGGASDWDFRATLTVVGSVAGTDVRVELGDAVGAVLGLDGAASYGPGDEVRVTLGPFDTLSLVTDAMLADFSGTVVTSSERVAVFSGSEGADAPIFDAIERRLCCADHVEGQLVPDDTLGTSFVLGLSPPRLPQINAAAQDISVMVAELPEREYARVLAVRDGTTVTTTLPPPDDHFRLDRGEVRDLVLLEDAALSADQPVSVIQMLASQDTIAVPPEHPGGDPAMTVVPPVDQFREEYVFLTPSTYAFDAVTLIVPDGATATLDETPIEEQCDASGPLSLADLAYTVHRCRLSRPVLRPDLTIDPGEQRDGVHRVIADRPVGVLVSGFDRFVSYAYAAGMNVERLY